MANLPVHHGAWRSPSRQLQSHPLDLFRTHMDELIDRFFGGSFGLFREESGPMRMWNFDVSENDKEFVVRAEMPGFDEKELDIQMNGDVLTIKAEKEKKSDGGEEYRSFYRSLTLPSGVDTERIQANYRNGMLELHIPRPVGTEPKRIPVQGQQAAKTQTQMRSPPSSKEAEPSEKNRSESNKSNPSHPGEKAGQRVKM